MTLIVCFRTLAIRALKTIRRDAKSFLSSNSCLGGSCRVPLKKRKHVLADLYGETTETTETQSRHLPDTNLGPPPLSYSPNALSSLNSPPQTPPTENGAIGAKPDANRYVPESANQNLTEYNALKNASHHEHRHCDSDAPNIERITPRTPENPPRVPVVYREDRCESVRSGEISSSYYVASTSYRSQPLSVQPSHDSALRQEHTSYAYNRSTHEGTATVGSYNSDRITYYESITNSYNDSRKVNDGEKSHSCSCRSGDRSDQPSNRHYDNYHNQPIDYPRTEAYPKSYQPQICYPKVSNTTIDHPTSISNTNPEFSPAVSSNPNVYVSSPNTYVSSRPYDSSPQEQHVSSRPESAPQPWTKENFPSRHRYCSPVSNFNSSPIPPQKSLPADSHPRFYPEPMYRPTGSSYTNLDGRQANYEDPTAIPSHRSPNTSDSLNNFLPSNLLSQEPAGSSSSKKLKKTKKYSYFINGKLLNDVASVTNSLGKQVTNSSENIHDRNVAELSEVFSELPPSEQVIPDFQTSEHQEVSVEEYRLVPTSGRVSRASASGEMSGMSLGASPTGANGGQQITSAACTMKKKKPRCSLCLNHGKSVDLKGHKDVCEYRACTCEFCIITKQRREAYKIQQNLNRRQDRERLLYDAEDGSSSQ